MAMRRWFPLSLVEQARFYANFTRGFNEIALMLGFTAEDIASLEADNAMIHYLVRMDSNIKAYSQAFNAMRDDLLKGKGNKMPSFVGFNSIEPPPPVTFGMFERLFRLADRILAAEKYTDVIGAQLGILQKSAESLNLQELKPDLKVKSIGENKIEVRFVRGRTDGVCLYFRRAGEDKAHELGRFLRSPAIVEIPLTDGKPEMIYVSGRYVLRNTAVGNVSPSVETIVAAG